MLSQRHSLGSMKSILSNTFGTVQMIQQIIMSCFPFLFFFSFGLKKLALPQKTWVSCNLPKKKAPWHPRFSTCYFGMLLLDALCLKCNSKNTVARCGLMLCLPTLLLRLAFGCLWATLTHQTRLENC